MVEKANIFINGVFSGVLSHFDNLWKFQYSQDYCNILRPLSYRMQDFSKVYESEKLFPFFEGLLNEGVRLKLENSIKKDSSLLDRLINKCSHSIGDCEIGVISSIKAPKDNTLVLDKQTAKTRQQTNYGKCLICFEKLDNPKMNYHEECISSFFGNDSPPVINFGRDDLSKLSINSISSGIAIPGVQEKIVVAFPDIKSQFIIKPQVKEYEQIPEIEALWMKIAKMLGIITAECGLIELQDKSLAYICKRFDRVPNEKIHLEDFGQLLDKSTYENQKFESSHEECLEIIQKYCNPRPKIQVKRFTEQLLFNYIFGNNDGHLKNWSLMTFPSEKRKLPTIILSPAYDLLPVAFLSEKSSQPQLAFPISKISKNKKFDRKELENVIKKFDISSSTLEDFVAMIESNFPKIEKLMENSFVRQEKSKRFLIRIKKRIKSLKI